MTNLSRYSRYIRRFLPVLLGCILLSISVSAQDPQDDPPGRVARLGYLQGSVSFQPAGETDWVGAVPNRPMTTGDQLWTDQDSRAEVQLGSAVIRLAPDTGFSFLNLDDHTVQIQLTSGAINITIRRLDDNDDFEIDTPNQAFTAFQPGRYRVEASSDGSYTVISVRQGDGQATGYGQSYDVRSGQRGTFSGTDALYANIESIYDADDFDNWSYNRDRRYDDSRSAQYLSRDVVGYEDLDQYGDWRDDPNYGHVWYPSQVDYGWAPYHEGHWDWISPWGWTWVDDSPWGYAPFHYGRWVSVGGRWGWVAGPVAVPAVYAPALVVFIGGGPGAFGGNVGWFALGPREVYVPSYRVSEAYLGRVNISNTNVTNVTITNVYNTTIIRNTTNITNITYANRDVRGAVTVVPQNAFVSAQPVARVAVAVNPREIASAPMSSGAAVAPTRASVLGSKSATAGHVVAPPAAVVNRQVVAKRTPPPPPVAFAKEQQALAAHPGQPLAHNEVQTLRPAGTATARPMVRVAPPARPATPTMGRPAGAPNATPVGQPTPLQPQYRPGNNRVPATQPALQPQQPAYRNQQTPAAPTRAMPQEEQPNRPPVAQPDNRVEPVRPQNQPQPNRYPSQPQAQPERPEQRTPPPPVENRPTPRPQEVPPPPSERPQPRAPQPEVKPAPPPPKEQPEATRPDDKKKDDKQKKDDKKKPPE